MSSFAVFSSQTGWVRAATVGAHGFTAPTSRFRGHTGAYAELPAAAIWWHELDDPRDRQLASISLSTHQPSPCSRGRDQVDRALPASCRSSVAAGATTDLAVERLH